MSRLGLVAALLRGIMDSDGEIRQLDRSSIAMRPIKAVYEDGHLMFSEGPAPEGRMEVIVVFPDQTEPASPRDKDAGKRFVEEWSGVLKGADIEGWREQRMADLEKKHQ